MNPTPRLLDWREILFWAALIVVVLMAREAILPALIFAIAVGIFLSLVAAVYLTYVYRRAPFTNWVFRILVQSQWRKAIAATWIGVLTVLRFVGHPVPREISSPVTAVVVLVLLTPGVVWAAHIYQRRRERRSPFEE